MPAFALLGGGPTSSCFSSRRALAVAALAGWSLAIAWVAALAQMLMLRDVQLGDVAVLGVLYATAAYGGRDP